MVSLRVRGKVRSVVKGRDLKKNPNRGIFCVRNAFKMHRMQFILHKNASKCIKIKSLSGLIRIPSRRNLFPSGCCEYANSEACNQASDNTFRHFNSCIFIYHIEFLNHQQGNNRQKYYLALGAGVFLFATMHVWHSIRTGTIKRHAQIIERQKVF